MKYVENTLKKYEKHYKCPFYSNIFHVLYDND